MKNLICSILFGLIIIPFSAQGADRLPDLTAKHAGSKIALVSISANNYGDKLQGWNSEDTTELMSSRLNSMLGVTETTFAADWDVIPASAFASKPEFLALAGEQRDVGLPMINDVLMPLFSTDRKELIKATIGQEVALALLDVTGAEFLLVVYSEWTLKSGNFIPTNKAMTKNVFSIYDNAGEQIFKVRLDKVGSKTLGAMGRVYVDADTIDQWSDSYNESVAAIYAGRKK
jgi:hypothetical protein